MSLAMLLGCTAASEEAVPKDVRPEGYGSLEFGMPFSEVIGQLDASLFNPASISGCFDDMPIEGCTLFPREDTSFFDMKDGIPYALAVDFDERGALSGLSLRYHREGNISRLDCLSIYERTLDWVQGEFGKLKAPDQADEQVEQRTTPGGIIYTIGTSENGFFVDTMSKEFSSNRKVWPFVSFIVVDGNPMCSIDVNIDKERNPT